MEVTKVSQITDNLKKYTYGGKDSDYITLTEWLMEKDMILILMVN